MALRTLIGAGLAVGAAGLAVAFASPASADPGGMNFGCSPCTAAADEETGTGAPWTDFFANAPWEGIFNTHGTADDPKGAWEQAFSGEPGASIPGSGSWEKAFPPAE